MFQAQSTSWHNSARWPAGSPPLSPENRCWLEQWVGQPEQPACPKPPQLLLCPASRAAASRAMVCCSPPTLVPSAVMPMQFLSPLGTRLMCVHVSSSMYTGRMHLVSRVYIRTPQYIDTQYKGVKSHAYYISIKKILYIYIFLCFR